MDKLNGKYEQQSNTSNMLFGINMMLAYFSTHMPLLPGDILATGTPPGVSFGRNRFMSVGDVLECGITNLVHRLISGRPTVGFKRVWMQGASEERIRCDT